MRTLALGAIAVAVVLAASPGRSIACAWPDNWLGAPDTNYVHLRIGVFYYGAVLDDMPDEQGVSHMPLGGTASDGSPLPATKEQWLSRMAAMPETAEDAQQGNLNQVMGELEAARQFYWRNSRFNCAITLDLLTADDAGTPQLWSTLAGCDAPYYSPLGCPKYAGVAESGKYDGLVQVLVLYRYNPQSGQLERVRGGGGFTIGCALRDETTGQKRCGWSWWAAPPADHACGSDWLFVHEFGHQLDSLFEQSGHPEHWFNHLARLEANTGPFGEHFDCMSYILRRTPEPDWRDLVWGEQRTFVDMDGDAVPDQNDLLAGLLTDPDPAKADADNDGLTDFWEYMAVNGNRNGHGERWHPAVSAVDPTNPDSDGSGYQDGVDPMPYLRMQNNVPAVVGSAYATLPGSGDAPSIEVQIVHDGDSLEIFLQWQNAPDEAPPTEVRVSLDLDNDGWFNGDDNYRIELTAAGLTRFVQNKAASDTNWPIEQAVDADLAHLLWILDDPTQYWQIRLKPGEITGLQVKSGERIGINIGVRPKGRQWFYMLGEPNGFIPLTLR
jgi:hypothetical protein